MFDIWIGDLELTTVVLIFFVVILLPVQVKLCFKIKSLFLRLMPVIILSILLVYFIVMRIFSAGWDGVGYAIFAIFVGFMMLICGIVWVVWAIAQFIKKHESEL